MSAPHATRWSLLGAARDGDPEAQTRLVALYRPSLVAWLRGAGAGDDAEDLAQEVLMRLFAGGVLARANPGAGRFRSLLLAVARHVLLDHRARTGAAKRGGGQRPRSLELDEAEATPAERAGFDREWLLGLVERALERLAREHPQHHAALRLHLDGRAPAQVAAALGLEPVTARSHLHRARQALARYLREEVWRYSADPDDHATEMRFLGELLQKGR